MNQLTLSKLLLATCFTAVTAVQVHAQGVHAAHLLGDGNSCFHVIRLIQMHGVNNSFDTGGMHLVGHAAPFGPFGAPGVDLGDLELVSIAMDPATDPACGPRFHVSIRNNSCRDVCSFHVTVVATLGRIFPGSPCMTVCVDRICAGEVADVCVQLPVEALAMGNLQGQVIGFQHVIVAIDAFDELAETNEANNIRAFLATEIPLVTAAVVEETVGTVVTESTAIEHTVAPAATAIQPAAVQPIAPQGLAPQAVAPIAAPVGDEIEGTDPLQTAIRLLDQPNPEATTAIATQ